MQIGRQVAEGLAAAHKLGLIHRDIKPDNIWLEARGEGPGARDEGSLSSLSPHAPHVKLLDFGLARAAAGNSDITQSGLIVGTPKYMAPEQANGEPVDTRSDLFGLGCVLYRLLAGQTPFDGSNALAVLKALATETPASLCGSIRMSRRRSTG